MKKVKDPFSYGARWDSAGINCVYCVYCKSVGMPPIELSCTFHNVSLGLELGKSGGINGEWFCKAFTDNGAFPKAVEELSLIKNQLEENILYEACQKEYLCMTPFDELEKIEN